MVVSMSLPKAVFWGYSSSYNMGANNQGGSWWTTDGGLLKWRPAHLTELKLCSHVTPQTMLAKRGPLLPSFLVLSLPYYYFFNDINTCLLSVSPYTNELHEGRNPVCH